MEIFKTYWKRKGTPKWYPVIAGFVMATDKADAKSIVTENIDNQYEVVEVTPAEMYMIAPQDITINFRHPATIKDIERSTAPAGKVYTAPKEKMNTVLKYPGAKNRIAEWICSYIPEHKVYLEPYAGSLAVLLNKQRSHIETVNDINGEVVNFFRVLRDYPEALKQLIELTPYSREEYDKSYQETDNDIERARRFCVRCWMGFGCSNLYRNGFKTGQQSKSPNPARAWDKLPETMILAAKRLKGVQIEQLPALELILRYDTPDVFIYADPTYLHGTRKNYLYKHEMPDEEHIDLLEALTKHKGRVMISGYDNEVYNYYLKNWEKAYKETVAEAGNRRTEVIWMNYHLNKQMTITDYTGATV